MIATGTGIIFIVTGIILGMRPPEAPPWTTPGTPPTAPATTAATTPPVAFPTAQEEALLLHVPKDFRATCRRATAPVQAYAKVVCTPSTDAKWVGYYRFSTTDKMYSWYFNIVDGKNIAHGAGHCKDDTVAEHTYPRGLFTVGHLACYRDGGKSYILWTYDRLAIGGVANRNDLKDDVLYQWWATTTNAGPLDPGVS